MIMIFEHQWPVLFRIFCGRVFSVKINNYMFVMMMMMMMTEVPTCLSKIKLNVESITANCKQLSSDQRIMGYTT